MGKNRNVVGMHILTLSEILLAPIVNIFLQNIKVGKMVHGMFTEHIPQTYLHICYLVHGKIVFTSLTSLQQNIYSSVSSNSLPVSWVKWRRWKL